MPKPPPRRKISSRLGGNGKKELIRRERFHCRMKKEVRNKGTQECQLEWRAGKRSNRRGLKQLDFRCWEAKKGDGDSDDENGDRSRKK